MSATSSRYAKLRVPAWLYGGDPRTLLLHAGLHGKAVTSEGPNVWAVTTDENYNRRTAAGLLEHRSLAGPGVERPGFDELGLVGRLQNPNLTTNESVEMVNKLGERIAATDHPTLATVTEHARLSMMVARSGELASICETVIRELREVTIEEDETTRPFEQAGLHVVLPHAALIYRVKFASVWLRLKYDDRLHGGDLSHILSNDRMAFASAADLHDGMLLFDAYVGPLLGSLTPFIWGFAAPRGGAVIIVTLGTPVSGNTPEAPELIQSLLQQGAIEEAAAPIIDDPRAYHSAIAWWTKALDNLFAVLSDLSIFTDDAGFYDPTSHLHALLTVEQLFRRTLSMQAAYRDRHARRVLLFSVLDTLERLTNRHVEQNCSHKFAAKTLKHLMQEIPTRAAQVLLPRAASAVDALETMREGFFLRDSPSSITVPTEHGTKEFDLDRAVARYLKMLRDATHGHGSARKSADPTNSALLARHTGEVPHELGWLGFLYLLDVMSRPDVLRRTLGARTT